MTCNQSVSRSLLALVLLCCGAIGMARPGIAQRTWIVDAAGGPGSTHRDIQPAVDAASDGDTILVRKGVYTRFATGKALRILGRPGATVDVSRSTQGQRVAALIQGLPAGKQFVLKGLQLRVFPMFGKPCVQVSGCKGLVLLERLKVPRNCYYFSQSIGQCHDGIHVLSSDQVVITGCEVSAADGISVSNSTVSIVGSVVAGQDSYVGRFQALPNTPALVFTNSKVALSGVRATGGKGGRSYNVVPGAPAIRATASDLVIAGTGGDRIAAGAAAISQSVPTAAIEMSGGSLWLAPSVQVVSNRGAPPVRGSYKRVPGTPVSLRGVGAPPGGAVALQIAATPGEAAYLLMAAPARPVATPWGALWLDPGSLVLLASAKLRTPAIWTRSIPVPAVPALRSLLVGFQALSGTPRGGAAMRLSNGLVVVID